MKQLLFLSLFFLTSLSIGAKESYPIYCSDGDMLYSGCHRWNNLLEADLKTMRTGAVQDRIDNPNAHWGMTSDLKDVWNNISEAINEIESLRDQIQQ